MTGLNRRRMAERLVSSIEKDWLSSEVSRCSSGAPSLSHRLKLAAGVLPTQWDPRVGP